MEMNAKTLKQICRELDLYQTPELNDKLYLHYKGFRSVDESINAYSGLLCLYLEGNCLTSTEGLDGLKQLKCLYIQENAIPTINLHSQVLSTLNCNQNLIQTISTEPLKQCLPSLHTLSISKNKLSTINDLEALRDHPNLSVLDLSNNRIATSLDSLLELLSTLPSLKVLYLKGNEFMQHETNTRKRVIGALKNLTYLDDRPVFDDERRLVDAWHSGGIEQERQAMQEMRQEKEQKQYLQWKQFDDLFKHNPSNQSSTQWDEKVQLSEAVDDEADSDDEIGANDDVDSDDDTNINQVNDLLSLNKQQQQPIRYVDQSLDDIDELSLQTERKMEFESKQHPSEAWTSKQSKQATQSSHRAIIEVLDDDDTESHPADDALVNELD